MSNEISISSSINLTKGEVKNRGQANNSIQVDQTGTGYVAGDMAVGIVAEAVDMGDLTTPGRYEWKCTGSYPVQIGSMESGAFVPFERLNAGEPGSGRLAITAPYVKAIGGVSRFDYFIAED